MRSALVQQRKPSTLNLELIVRAQGGDSIAQEELVRQYRLRVQGYVRSIIGPLPAVEDVSQLVFIKMFRALAGLRDLGSFEPWLFCLTRNGARDYLRRSRIRATTPLSDHEWNALADAGDDLGRSQLLRDVRSAIDLLNARDQELISMVIEGHCQQLIARRQSTTVGAIKARLRRLRMALKCTLEQLWNGGARPGEGSASESFACSSGAGSVCSHGSCKSRSSSRFTTRKKTSTNSFAKCVRLARTPRSSRWTMEVKTRHKNAFAANRA